MPFSQSSSSQRRLALPSSDDDKDIIDLTPNHLLQTKLPFMPVSSLASTSGSRSAEKKRKNGKGKGKGKGTAERSVLPPVSGTSFYAHTSSTPKSKPVSKTKATPISTSKAHTTPRQSSSRRHPSSQSQSQHQSQSQTPTHPEREKKRRKLSPRSPLSPQPKDGDESPLFLPASLSLLQSQARGRAIDLEDLGGMGGIFDESLDIDIDAEEEVREGGEGGKGVGEGARDGGVQVISQEEWRASQADAHTGAASQTKSGTSGLKLGDGNVLRGKSAGRDVIMDTEGGNGREMNPVHLKNPSIPPSPSSSKTHQPVPKPFRKSSILSPIKLKNAYPHSPGPGTKDAANNGNKAEEEDEDLFMSNLLSGLDAEALFDIDMDASGSGSGREDEIRVKAESPTAAGTRDLFAGAAKEENMDVDRNTTTHGGVATRGGTGSVLGKRKTSPLVAEEEEEGLAAARDATGKENLHPPLSQNKSYGNVATESGAAVEQPVKGGLKVEEMDLEGWEWDEDKDEQIGEAEDDPKKIDPGDDQMTGRDRKATGIFQRSSVKAEGKENDYMADKVANPAVVKLGSSSSILPPRIKTLEIGYEANTAAITAEQPLAAVAKKEEIFLADDLEGYDFDIPFSQESFLSHDDNLNDPTPTVNKYPIWHPPVHPLDAYGKHVGEEYEATPWARCSVVEVVQPEAGSEDQWGWGEKVILLEDVRCGLRYRLRLREDATELFIAVGDIMNLISPLVKEGTTSIKTPNKASLRRALAMHASLPPKPTADGSPAPAPSPYIDAPVTEVIISHNFPENFIVHHPDVLIPMTSLAGSISCRRKPIIQGLLKGGGRNATTKPLLYGNILHELLQDALQTKDFSQFALRKKLDQLLRRPDMQLDMWAAELGFEDVKAEVWEKAGLAILQFGGKWVGPAPKPEAQLHGDSSKLSIVGLHDIEESIWSPKWGLKGKVDASVHAELQIEDSTRRSKRASIDHAEEAVSGKPMPFEIKTGRAVGVMEHRAQTMLYTLLMEERYQTDIPSGLLYYTQTDSLLEVAAAKPEVRSLLSGRNELAGYMSRKRILQERSKTKPSASQKSASGTQPVPLSAMDIEELPVLPWTIDDPRECRSCYANEGCMLYRKTLENIASDPEDPIAELYERKMGHLTDADKDFFVRWEQLITLEEQETIHHKNQVWTSTAAEREKSGRCFADMVIHDYQNNASAAVKISRHVYTFRRNPQTTPARHQNFLTGHIGKNDPVSLSIEPDLVSIARGFVTKLDVNEVVISTDLPIDVDPLLERTKRSLGDRPVFRIDKDEMLSGTARMRSNLAQLFYSEESGGDQKRRELIVQGRDPVFEPVWAPDAHEIPDSLNPDQKAAMHHVMTAKDYACILGMPGTGKTTTIAEIILALVARGKSVLLTSYTHSAVDTILMKLVNAGHRILRLGNPDKVHPDVKHLTLDNLGYSSSLSQLEEVLMTPPIVATTCLSIDHPIFTRRRFDYCIVDEASQITLPTCIGPLRLADTFVLVGDHFQLPPIVKNAEARKGGLDTSLFRLLTDMHPTATVELGYQYRMNADIMAISNRLIYSGKLKCGTDTVARQTLTLPKSITSAHKCHSHCWITKLLDEECKVAFVDTDRVPGREIKLGDLVQNPTEAKLILQFVESLILGGIKQEAIGIITPYRQQIKLLSSMLSDPFPNVEILTADKSQGRDKDCIIISMVRSNDIGNIGELLRDWRRINVSFTRAKKKLVIFGSRLTLKTDRLLKDFFALMEANEWVHELAKNAHE